jgi:hypothetical protein
MNYSLFIMETEEMMSMEAKGQLGVAPAVSPLLSLQSSDLFRLFYASTLPPHKIARGGIYIVSFR